MKYFTEEQIEKIVFENLPEIFPELTPVALGYHIDRKAIVDIHAKDKDGVDCLIELKEGKLNPHRMRSLMGQLLHYGDTFLKKQGANAKLYAVAEEFSKDQTDYLNRRGIICGEYCILPVFQKMRTEMTEKERELDEIERKKSEIIVGLDELVNVIFIDENEILTYRNLSDELEKRKHIYVDNKEILDLALENNILRKLPDFKLKLKMDAKPISKGLYDAINITSQNILQGVYYEDLIRSLMSKDYSREHAREILELLSDGILVKVRQPTKLRLNYKPNDEEIEKIAEEWKQKQEGTGKFDIDIIATGISHSQHERMRTLIDIIQRLCNESKDGDAARVDVIREAEIESMKSNEAEEALDRLKRNGQIYEPVRGKYKVTEY